MRSVLSLARRGVAFELALYRSLLRWVSRRPDVEPGGVGFGYVGAVALLLWVFIGVSAVELVVVHVLLPWDTVRLVADVVGIWGLVWMLGLAASYSVYPHVVADSGLRVRQGHGIDLTVPWDAIATIGVRERSRDTSKSIQVDRDDDRGGGAQRGDGQPDRRRRTTPAADHRPGAIGGGDGHRDPPVRRRPARPGAPGP